MDTPLNAHQREARERLRAVLANYNLLDPIHGLGRDVDEAVRWALGALADPTPTDAAALSRDEAPASLVALHRRLYDAAMREKRAQAEMVIRPDIEEKALAHDEAEMDRIAAYLDLLAWTPAAPSAAPEVDPAYKPIRAWTCHGCGLRSFGPVSSLEGQPDGSLWHYPNNGSRACGPVTPPAPPEVEALRAERDEARAIVARINNEVFGSEGYFTTPDAVEAVGRLKVGANAARAALAEMVKQKHEPSEYYGSYDDLRCAFCGEDYVGHDRDEGERHTPGCAWMAARAVLAGSAPTPEAGRE